MVKRYKQTTMDDLATDLEFASLNKTPAVVCSPASVCSSDSQDSILFEGVGFIQLAAPQSKLKSKLADALENAGQAGTFWSEFNSFSPNPKATFKQEFKPLMQHLNVSNYKTKRRYLKRAINSGIRFFYARFEANPNMLDCWQELCEEVGLTKRPTSIIKCKEALRGVHVNLFNLIDHRRNPDVAIRHFCSHAELSHSIRKSSLTFPRECAKADGFIRVLLKKL